MLPRSRSWSLPPSFGLRRRDASPVDRRRHRRSQSFSERLLIRSISIFLSLVNHSGIAMLASDSSVLFGGFKREMDKVISMLDRYEEQQMTRLLKLKAYGIMLAAFLDEKKKALSSMKVRFKKFMGDPQHDTEGLIRRGEGMSKKIIEELSCEREDDVVRALSWIEEKEDEFMKKIEIVRTLQMLSIRRKSANQSC